MPNLIFISLIFLITILNGCKEDEPNHTLWFPYEADTWIDFSVGTYWVYQNLETFEVDTLEVVSVGIDSLKVKKEKYYTKYVKCESKNNFTSFNFSVATSSPFVSLCSDELLRKCIHGLPFPLDEGNEMPYSPTSSSRIDSVFETYYLETLDSNLTNTIKVSVIDDQIQNVENSIYYWSKSIGIIKIILIDNNQTWILIDYSNP